MLLRILAIGNKMPSWVTTGYQEYAKRFPLELIEIPAEKRLKQSDIAKLTQLEGQKMLSLIKPSNRVIALEVKGQSWSTEQLAEQLKTWQLEGRNIDLLIGGADGLAPECLQRAEIKWSLSALTLPHPLVRILLAEQLYRAHTILQNHPYHRA